MEEMILNLKISGIYADVKVSTNSQINDHIKRLFENDKSTEVLDVHYE